MKRRDVPQQANRKLDTLLDNLDTGTKELLAAIRQEWTGNLFLRDERMSHYDAMLQALTELECLHYAELRNEHREAVAGLTQQIELLREEIEALKVTR